MSKQDIHHSHTLTHTLRGICMHAHGEVREKREICIRIVSKYIVRYMNIYIDKATSCDSN